ncbi:MAG: CBS domain-containing protein [Chloroflexota bacterium]
MDLTPEAVTQATSIGEVDRLLRGTDPILVNLGDSLHRLAKMAVERPGCRVLSVVDESGLLVGLVPVRLLVNDIFLKIVPEEFLGVITDMDDVMEYARHLGARTAGDIMLRPTSVRRDATVRDAFETMHHARLNGLPIVDEKGRVVSYLDQLELLLVWVRASGREPLLHPSADADTGTDGE